MRQILLEFINAINEHDPDKIYELMTEDHVFIDSQSFEYKGRQTMKEGWKGYFEMFPDYKIDVKEILNNTNHWYMFGFASGTYLGKEPENFWRIPAAWKAVITGDKIKHWQVYADTKIPFDIMEASK
jgi:ketosteroid isomerase-like protein